jgi:YspA, cpYpsA-related SLOG family
MRVLVCGGREFTNRAGLQQSLDALNAQHGPFTCLMHGGAVGADTEAGLWAEARSIPVQVFAADWEGEGHKAGPKRNRRMLAEGKPDLVVAFPGKYGTAHMVRIAKLDGVRTVEIGEEARCVRPPPC